MTTNARAYARSHTAAYASDKIAGLMKRLVKAFGFDPRGVADGWTEWIDLAARTWMESGHLTGFKIQFHMPGETLVRGGFEFPIRYDGNGEADLYVDETHFRDSIAKAERPPSGAVYRIVLTTSPGAPSISGIGDVPAFSMGALRAREAGSVIVTPDLMASARYYKK
ncbi:MAG: hypothetical protein Q8K32_07090 [Archangium sp.]|nr:hypothetical protein [Archangium sp.]